MWVRVLSKLHSHTSIYNFLLHFVLFYIYFRLCVCKFWSTVGVIAFVEFTSLFLFRSFNVECILCRKFTQLEEWLSQIKHPLWFIENVQSLTFITVKC